MMQRTLGAITIAMAAFAAWLPATPAHAFPWDECTTNANCPQAKPTCVKRFFMINRCVNICNTDSQCMPNFVCLRGTCTNPSFTSAPTSTPAPVSGRPAGQATRCNPPDGSRPHGTPVVDANGKPVGACPSGTVCTRTGFCARPEK